MPVKRTTPYTKYKIGEKRKRLFSIALSFYMTCFQPRHNIIRRRTWGESTMEKVRGALTLSYRVENIAKRFPFDELRELT
jgi:hypothetical protein